MMTIQQGLKQFIKQVENTDRTHLSERSLKIAEENLAKMRKILKRKKQVKHAS